MTKKKESKPGIMSEISEEEIRMSGIYDTHYYSYRCRDCRYEAKVEDIVVDSFLSSLRSKHRMPQPQCFPFVSVVGLFFASKIFKARTGGALY